MEACFTVSDRENFNIIWTKAAKTKNNKYPQPKPGKEPKRGAPPEPGQPTGINNNRLNYHRNWARLWKEWVEELAEAEGRPPNYSLIYDPPAKGSGQEEQTNGAKLLAFYQWLLDWYEEHSGAQKGVNTQLDKCSLAFFRHLLAAQFDVDGRSKRLQGYSILTTPDQAAIQALGRSHRKKVRERGPKRDPYSETLGASLREDEALKLFNATKKVVSDLYKWEDIICIKAILCHMYQNANRKGGRSSLG